MTQEVYHFMEQANDQGSYKLFHTTVNPRIKAETQKHIS